MLEHAWREWQRAWGIASGVVEIASSPSVRLDREDAWTCVGARGDAAGWLRLPGTFDASLSRSLWDLERTDTPIAMAVQSECRQDLFARIAAALGVDEGRTDQALVPAAVGAWSGVLGLELPWGARVVLNAQAVQALQKDAPSGRGKPPALVPVAAAVSGHALPLRVHLADCELDIGSLRELQAGDVLRLQHRLDAPLQVRDFAGRTLFCAFLARRRQFKAVQLAPVASGAPAPASASASASAKVFS